MRARPGGVGPRLVGLATARPLALAVAIFLLGAALRLYRPDIAPPGLYYDEAANGVDALDVLAGWHPMFFPGNQGREPLHIYLTALTTALVGPGWLAVRLPAMLAGLLALPATYLLGREVGGQRTGLLAALLLSTSYWHLSLSRMAFRAAWTPVVVALGLALLLAALRTGRRRSAAAAGAVFGLGLYTYLAARVAPALIIAVPALALVWSRHSCPSAQATAAPASRDVDRPKTRPRLEPTAASQRRESSKRADERPAQRCWRSVLAVPVVAGVVATLFAAPLGLYFLRHMDLFWGRVENASGGALSPPERVVTAFGTFVWAGDLQARHNLPELPAFDPIAGGLFLLGLALCLRRPLTPARLALPIATALMLLPQALATGEPHYLRAAGALTPAVAIAALGATAVLDRLPRDSWRLLAAAALAALWTVTTATAYFRDWAPSRDAYEAFEAQGRDAAQLAASLGAQPSAVDAGPASTGPPIAAGGPIYADRPTFYLGDDVLPFDAARGVVVPPGDGNTIVTTSFDRPVPPRTELGEPLVVAGRWPATDGSPSVALYRIDPRTLAPATRVAATFGGVAALEGYDSPAALPPGAAQPFSITWRVLGPAPAGLRQFAHAVAPVPGGERLLTAEDADPYPSRWWRGGELVRSWWQLELPADAPPGAYWIETGFYAAPEMRRLPVADGAGRPAGDRVLLGPFRRWDPRAATPRPATPVADFDGALLASVDASPAASPGEKLPLTLRWWSERPTAAALTQFVHLLDASGRERAGADGPPSPSIPTAVWQPGESTVATSTLALPADLPPGRYKLEVGLYDAATGRRLPLLRAPERLGDAAIVASVDVR